MNIFILIIQFFVGKIFLFFKKGRERHSFEKNSKITFEKNADYCFEISSEGELEQVKPLLFDFLSRGYICELVYSSPSVEDACKNIELKYQEQVRLFKLPLVSYVPFLSHRSFLKFTTSKIRILCRYDFYPELVFKRKEDIFILLWGSLKNYKKKSFLEKFLLKKIYSSFDYIFAATKKDEELFREIISSKPKVIVYDFRPYQILKRLNDVDKKIASIFVEADLANKFFKTLNKRDVAVLGNYWPSDVKVLREFLNSSFKVIFIVPHLLNKEVIDGIKEELLHHDVRVMSKNSIDEFSPAPNMDKPLFIILNLKGFLCELYSFSSYAYVSGGFTLSVHSLLEPAMSGNAIVCGPRVHRSTEYDLIIERSSDMISVADNEASVAAKLIQTSVLDSQILSTWHKEILLSYDEHLKTLLFLLGDQNA